MKRKLVPDHAAASPRDGMDAPVAALRAGGSTYALLNDSIIHAASEAIVTIDELQRIVMLNPAAQRMFACSAADVLGRDLSVLIPPRFRKAHARHVRAFDQSGTAERPMGERQQLMGLRASGDEFPIEASISRVDVADSLGTRGLFSVLLRDVSEVTRLRGEVAAFISRQKVIFELAPIAVWIIDGDCIVYANRACADLFGTASHGELVGRSVYTLLDPQSHASVRHTVARALESGLPITTENQKIARVDGVVRDVDIALAALPDHGHTVLQMALTDITIRSRESRELERSRRELRELSASMVDAREEERQRIAREMHDELGQRLTALQMELSGLRALEPSRVADARIQAMLCMVEETIAAVRRMSTELRPLMLDDLGLNAAVEWLAHDWSERMGIRVNTDLGEQEPEIGVPVAIAVYRMVQEALTNVARHARASRVMIRLRQRADELELTVQDDGIGFPEPTSHRSGSHGLLGIRERAYMLGGHLATSNAPAGGARVTVCLPLRSGGDATLTDEPPLAEGGSGSAPLTAQRESG